jgi:ribosomal protein S27AE
VTHDEDGRMNDEAPTEAPRGGGAVTRRVGVDVALMDSAREPARSELVVHALSRGRRAGRAASRGLVLAAVSAVVVVLPLLHLFGVVGLLVAVPVAVVLGYRTAVLVVGAQAVPCPKCGAAVPVKDGQGGWPVRLHCDGCGGTLFARPAPGSTEAPGGAA